MTDEDLSTQTAVSAVEEVQANASSLDLTWGLRPAQVNDITGNAVQIILDGDTNLVPAISLIGTLAKGARVWVLKIPPSGSYVVGFAAGPALPGAASFDKFAAVQSKNDVAYASMLQLSGANAATTFIKQRKESRIAYTVVVDAFATAIGAVADIGLQINSTDYSVTSFFFNAAADHRQMTGPGIIDDSASRIPAGTYTVTLRWRRVSGAQINTDNNSRLMFLLWEVAV
jgi:hypothetical protein